MNDFYKTPFVARRKIRILLSLLFLCSLSFSALASSGDLVRLKFKNESLETVLSEIAKQSNKMVLFKHSDIGSQKVSIQGDYKLDEALTKALVESGLSFEVVDSHIIIKKKAPKPAKPNTVTSLSPDQEEGKAISGSVKNDQGEGLPGVNVMIKGTTKGAVTDVDGRFTIKVKKSDVLSITYIGHKAQEILVGNRTSLDIILQEDMTELEQVVVVGYGIQKKVNITGAIDVVTAKELENRPVANVQQALQGAAPGLALNVGSGGGEMDAAMNMNIRGVGSISNEDSDGDPFVLVDGMPLNSLADMNKINPNDIESVSVLKDAASTAIYGSRAAFGVILITTKSGSATDGFSVNYSSNFVVASPVKTPQQMSSLEWGNYMNAAYVNEGKNPAFGDELMQRITDYINDPENTPETVPNSKGTNWAGNYANANRNWYETFYKDNTSWQQHNLSLAGKQKHTQYYLSGAFFQREGLLRFGDEQQDRYTFNGKISTKVTDKVKVSLNSTVSHIKYDLPSYFAGNRDLFLHNVARTWPNKALRSPNGGYVEGRVAGLVEGGRAEKIDDAYTNILSVEVEPLKGLKFTGTLNHRYTNKREESFKSKYGYTLPNGDFKYHNSKTSYTTSNNQRVYISPTVIGSYERTVEKHFFKVLGGFQQDYYYSKYSRLSKDDLVTTEVPAIGTALGETLNGKESKSEWSTRGFFGRLNYNYQEKYLVEANFRYDASSKFASEDRWGFFPSFSLGYNIAKENFWPVPQIGVMKFRASYGALGNQNVAANLFSARMKIRTKSTNPRYNWIGDNGRRLGIYAPDLISTDLTWETVTTKNIGLDMAAFDNRLTLGVDAFVRETTDMIGPAESYSARLGTSAPKSNNAELSTKGFEISVGWKGNVGSLSYNARFNIGNAMTEITSYRNPEKYLGSGRGNYYEGRKLGEIWGYRTHGIFQTDDEAKAWHDQSYIRKKPFEAGDIGYEDLNGDGKIDRGDLTVDNPGDMEIIGNSTAQFPYSFQFGANWKGFDFSMLWQGIGKRDVAPGGPFFYGASGGKWQMMGLEEHLDYWTPENPNAYFARPLIDNEEKNQQTQTRYLQDASYLRLKNLQVGYNLPKSVLSVLHLEQFRIYVAAENILTFTDLIDSLDPETVSGRWFGSTGKVYPLQKTMSVGVNIKL
ncbi:SusC/RagA family TonB-linked outer membrane protein [Fulvitalea axinellae]|uniref:SusC/RagA family TonB-linked outer membrane protein n=1 Tax=Fulvitalea axinellae TaxID=1182444 RepID=A0AAU9CJ53_9BACT|nr:SusC/RagA family TonB-linked outer membrane protein [Fulvitalea axinellae]